MVKVQKSRGKGFVNVEILGIAEVRRVLEKKNKRVLTATEIETLRVGNFVQQEVQESIIGNRVEPRSVNTGRLANNIDLDFLSKTSAIIFPSPKTYPNSKTTVEEVALFLEKGTTKIAPRKHFENTLARTEKKITKMYDDAVNLSLK